MFARGGSLSPGGAGEPAPDLCREDMSHLQGLSKADLRNWQVSKMFSSWLSTEVDNAVVVIQNECSKYFKIS